MKTLTILPLLLTSICFAQGTYVKLSDKVSDFKNRISEDILPNHKDWVLGNLTPYEIVKDPSLGGYLNQFKTDFPMASKYVDDDILIFQNKVDTAKLIEDHMNSGKRMDVSLSSMHSFCKYSSKFRLGFMGGEVEYDNYEAHYLDGKLYKMNMRYRRIFHGGIIRNNLSYIEMTFNLSGEVEKLEIKWPKFKKVVEAHTLLTHEELFVEYKKDASLQTKVANESGDTASIDSIETVGAAFAWCHIEGENRIVPAMSFIQAVNFEDKKIHTIVDVPYFRRYMK